MAKVKNKGGVVLKILIHIDDTDSWRARAPVPMRWLSRKRFWKRVGHPKFISGTNFMYMRIYPTRPNSAMCFEVDNVGSENWRE